MADAGLSPERFAALQRAFEEALDQPDDARESALAALAVQDADLAVRVRALLAAHAQSGTGLQIPISAEQLLDVTRERWIGARVGNYELVRWVGAGGMGTVYEAVRADDSFRKRVAIKLLATQATSDVAVQRFRRERQILADLAHPNIAALLDGGLTDEGQPFFAMEFVEGAPITSWCDVRNVPLAERLALMRQVCAAVQYAHQSLVVHRDLKPGNILVDADGQAKLLDFGIAMLLPGERDEADTPTLTRPGGRAFTPDYAAPEQLLGLPIGTRADVYALGVVLYELVTGRRPYVMADKSALQIERLLDSTTTPRPSSCLTADRAVRLGARSLTGAQSRVAGDLDAIILKALHRDPSRRYGSADELSAELLRFLEGRPVLAQPDGLGYRLGKLVRRRRAETVAVVVGSLAVIAGTVVSTTQARRALRERARATEVTTFLTTMLGSAKPEQLGRDVKVREVLDSAALRANALRDRPDLEAEIRGIIGGTYLSLGEFALAEREYGYSVDAHRRAAPAGDRGTGTALSNLSLAIELQGRFEQADTVLQRAAALHQRFGFDNEEARGDFLDSQGRIFQHFGKLAEADSVLTLELAVQRENPQASDSSVVNAYANLAVVRGARGLNAQAETLMLAAADHATRAFGATHPMVASVLSPLATIQEAAGSLDAAGETYRRALVLREKLLGTKHPDYAWTRLNYADHLMVRGKWAESLVQVRGVLSLRGTSLPDTHVLIPSALLVLARDFAHLDSAAAAESAAREAWSLRRTHLPKGHYLTMSALSIYGEVLTLGRRYADAERMLVDAERGIRDAGLDGGPILMNARKRLVTLYEAWGKPADAARWKAQTS